MPGDNFWNRSKQASAFVPSPGVGGNAFAKPNRPPMAPRFRPTAPVPPGAGRAGPPPMPLNGLRSGAPTPVPGMPRPPMMPDAYASRASAGYRPPGANMAMQQRFNQLQANRPPQDPAMLERARAAFAAGRAGAPVQAGTPPPPPPQPV